MACLRTRHALASATPARPLEDIELPKRAFARRPHRACRHRRADRLITIDYSAPFTRAAPTAICWRCVRAICLWSPMPSSRRARRKKCWPRLPSRRNAKSRLFLMGADQRGRRRHRLAREVQRGDYARHFRNWHLAARYPRPRFANWGGASGGISAQRWRKRSPPRASTLGHFPLFFPIFHAGGLALCITAWSQPLTRDGGAKDWLIGAQLATPSGLLSTGDATASGGVDRR